MNILVDRDNNILGAFTDGSISDRMAEDIQGSSIQVSVDPGHLQPFPKRGQRPYHFKAMGKVVTTWGIRLEDGLQASPGFCKAGNIYVGVVFAATGEAAKAVALEMINNNKCPIGG